jgi:predicted GTPase
VTNKELGSLVSEQGNPGNSRNVVRATVQVPSPRLTQAILLADTPGLGSLARRGRAETLAYLPSCDLALLLIDAGTALNKEDVGTLRLLSEAAIRKLLHEISRIAEQALDRARKVKEEGAPAVLSAIEGLNRLERDISALA